MQNMLLHMYLYLCVIVGAKTIILDIGTAYTTQQRGHVNTLTLFKTLSNLRFSFLVYSAQ